MLGKKNGNRERELQDALLSTQKKLYERTQELQDYKDQLASIKDNKMFTGYKVARKTADAPKSVYRFSKKGIYIVAKNTLKSDRSRHFVAGTAKKVRKAFGLKSGGKNTRLFVDAMDSERAKRYQTWFKKHWPTDTILVEQRKVALTWKYQPKISILVPTYNTPLHFLDDLIKSVQNQSYENWELCFADDNSPQAEVRRFIENAAKADKRIVYTFRKKNGHISAASNSALEIATGEFVGLLDHDDILWPNALYEVVKALNENTKLDFIYSDEDKISEDGSRHEDAYFKPDWSPDHLRCHNYITHFSVIRTKLINKVGGFREGCEGAQDWDLILRVTNETDDSKIHHIPTILYSWRKARTSTALRADAKDYAWEVQEKVLVDDLARRNIAGTIRKTSILGFWRMVYDTPDMPLVSIIIPTKDQHGLIANCLSSIAKLSTYPNYEIIIVDTGSTDQAVWDMYDVYCQQNQRTKVVKWEKPFNFSAVCNYGAKHAGGDYLLFLNNDTEVISCDWIEAMLGHAQLDHVGAVGAKLLYPNGHIQHSGIVLGMGGFPDTPAIAGHIFAGWDNGLQDQYKIMFTEAVRNSSAVTAAVLMVSKKKFDSVKGFDESFKIAFNDVDFNLKLRQKGWYNVYLPYVQLYHHESVSVGRAEKSERDVEAFKEEHRRMAKKWGAKLFKNDPFFNPNYDRKQQYVAVDPDAEADLFG